MFSAIIWLNEIISVKGNRRQETERVKREEGSGEKAGEVEAFEHFDFLATEITFSQVPLYILHRSKEENHFWSYILTFAHIPRLPPFSYGIKQFFKMQS